PQATSIDFDNHARNIGKAHAGLRRRRGRWLIGQTRSRLWGARGRCSPSRPNPAIELAITDRARADFAADSIRAVASVVEDDMLHQADEELGLALVLAGPIVKL